MADMTLLSHPVGGLKGIAKVAGDKSISHRALMFGVMAEGTTTITGLLEGEDVLRTAKALISMGAVILPPDTPNGVWTVEGMGQKPLRTPRTSIYLGNSGTSARLLMGLVAGYPLNALFTGDESLSKRPMGRVIKPLAQMGAQFEMSTADKLPIRVIGSSSLRAINYTLPVASAQVKSAILLAGLHAKGVTTVVEPQQTRDHTERMLRHFGAKVTTADNEDGSALITVEGNSPLTGQQIFVPADPSSAAFLVVAALITKDSDIAIPNVCINAKRIGLYTTLQEMGADIVFGNIRDRGGEPIADIRVKSCGLKGIVVPPSRVPSMIDEFPILAVAAAFAEGKTVMTGLSELRVKESDRLSAIAKGLTASGVKVEMGEDSLTVEGGGIPHGGCTIATAFDHRIAMSFLVMGMATKTPIMIDDGSSIVTSFPDFVRLVNSLGANVK
jgi:3-phosphoshikimate 1-carboxyvinyltransferase